MRALLIAILPLHISAAHVVPAGAVRGRPRIYNIAEFSIDKANICYYLNGHAARPTLKKRELVDFAEPTFRHVNYDVAKSRSEPILTAAIRRAVKRKLLNSIDLPIFFMDSKSPTFWHIL